MGPFVVVGRDVGARDPTLALGPYDTREQAEAEAERLKAAAHGVYRVLALHKLREPSA